MARGGAHTLEKKNGTRRCVLTGTDITAKVPALRFVLHPDGHLMADLAAKLPGRGAWLMAGPGYLEAAFIKGSFKKSFKSDVSLPANASPHIYSEKILELMKQATLARLGLLRKSGYLVTGFEKCRKLIKSSHTGHPCAAYIVASNAGPDGREKIEKLLGNRLMLKPVWQPNQTDALAAGPSVAPDISDRPALPLIDLFTGEELSHALGTENFVHGIVTCRTMAAGFIRESRRLARFR